MFIQKLALFVAGFLLILGTLFGMMLPAQAQTTSPAGQTGVISQVSRDRVTLRANDHTLSYAMPASTIVKIDGNVVGIGDLKVGMSAIVFSTDGKTATEVRAYTQHTTTTTKPTTEPTTQPANGQTGVISQVSRDRVTIQANSHTFSYAMPASTIVKVDGKVVGIGDLKVGMSAIVFSTDGKAATEVRAYTQHTTTTTQPTTQPTNGQTGVISQVRGDGITIQTSNHSLSYAVPPSTVVKVDGNPASIGDLKVGMSALVFSTDGKTATEVRAYTPHTTTNK